MDVLLNILFQDSLMNRMQLGLIEIHICDNVEVFIVIFKQFNASLLKVKRKRKKLWH